MTETLGRLGGRRAVSPAAGQEGSMLLAGIVRREGGGKHCWQVRTRHLFLRCFFKVKSEEGEQTFVGEGKICHSLIIIGEVLSL